MKRDNKKLKTRVSKIKGQLNGLETMLDNNTNCLEVFNQLAAIKGALSSLGKAIVDDETSCLRINKNDEKKLQDILKRFIKIN